MLPWGIPKAFSGVHEGVSLFCCVEDCVGGMPGSFGIHHYSAEQLLPGVWRTCREKLTVQPHKTVFLTPCL